MHPDGASTRITYGVLNLAHRESHENPSALTPGKEEGVVVTLDHIGYRVPKGHKLRVAISNAYWPLIWPAPQASKMTLHSGLLALTERPTAGGDEHTFKPPTAADPWETEEIRPENHIRRQETDMTTGMVSLIIEDDFGKTRDADHGLINGSIARERWDINPDDPLCARGTCHWTDELERDDIKLRTETHSAMWADSTHFYLKARIEAYENDTLIYERDISDSIKREML